MLPLEFRDKFDGSSAFCKTCPTGQFMPYEGGTECSTCPKGQYTSTCQGQSDSGKIWIKFWMESMGWY